MSWHGSLAGKRVTWPLGVVPAAAFGLYVVTRHWPGWQASAPRIWVCGAGPCPKTVLSYGLLGESHSAGRGHRAVAWCICT